MVGQAVGKIMAVLVCNLGVGQCDPRRVFPLAVDQGVVKLVQDVDLPVHDKEV